MINPSDESLNGGTPSVSSPEEAATMPAIEKFLFDRSFDTDKPDPVEETEEGPEEEEPEEIVPTFSEEEMKTARDEAFTKGKEEGVNEDAAATEQNLLASMEKLNEQFTNLFKSQEEADATILDSAVSVATMISRKIFPALNERGALEEVERLVVVALEKVLEEPSVSVYVHPDIEPVLSEHMGSLTAQANYRGEIRIFAAEDIPVGDCRVEWDGGGARRDTESLWQEIDEIVERNLLGIMESNGKSPEPATETPTEPISGETETAPEAIPSESEEGTGETTTDEPNTPTDEDTEPK
jgi:flagellar assembly protein FliH